MTDAEKQRAYRQRQAEREAALEELMAAVRGAAADARLEDGDLTAAAEGGTDTELLQALAEHFRRATAQPKAQGLPELPELKHSVYRVPQQDEALLKWRWI